jgi:hypothetical protein
VSGRLILDLKDICGRMVILHDGKIQAAGNWKELMAAPDAVRCLAPVLSMETIDRILNMIGGELGDKTVLADNHSSPLPLADLPLPASILTGVEKVLAPLIKKDETALPPALPVTGIDSVNHEKLAELARRTSPEETSPET